MVEQQKTKAEIFAENPDRFEDIKNVSLIVKPMDGSYGILINVQTLNEVDIIKCRVNRYLDQVATQMQLAALKEKSGGLVKPGDKGFVESASKIMGRNNGQK